MKYMVEVTLRRVYLVEAADKKAAIAASCDVTPDQEEEETAEVMAVVVLRT